MGNCELSLKFWKCWGTLESLNFGTTWVNLLGGTVGVHLGEPSGPSDIAAPLDTE